MPLSEYTDYKKLGEQYAELVSTVREGLPCSAFGIQFSNKCLIAASLPFQVLYITNTVEGGRLVATEIGELSGKKAVFLGPKDDVLLFKRSFRKDSLYERLKALDEISRGVDVVVTTFEALLQLFPARVEAEDIRKGTEHNMGALAARLSSMGYVRTEIVEKKGTFAVRGDVFDVYPVNSDEPYRMEFFGDEVEDIRTFDPATGLKTGDAEDFRIVMATDVSVDPSEKRALLAELSKSSRKCVKNGVFRKSAVIFSELSAAVEAGGADDRLQFVMPLLKNVTDDVFAYLDKDAVVVYDEPKLVYENLLMVRKEHEERIKQLIASGEAYDFTERQLTQGGVLLGRIAEHRTVALQSMTYTSPLITPLRIFKFETTPVARYSMRMGDVVADIGSWNAGGYGVIVCCADPARAAKLYDELLSQKIYAEVSDTFDVPVRGVKLTTFMLTSGFVCHQTRLAVIGSGDLYLKTSSEKKLKKRRGDLFSAPTVGDYAVHEQYGIGLVLGTKKIETASGVKDYIAVSYAGGDVLYVSVEQMDKLTKYLGGEEKPKLDKIGAKDFERVKERVRQSVRTMTVNLRKLYRERAGRVGFKFSPDGELMKMFEDSFEYEETEDQLSSIAEIKADMESDSVMDRLLCGDVGFGKTEVALRAAFKAVLDGKQVAIIAPTTILSTQHFATATARFRDFGVTVDLINRFRTPKEIQTSLQNLKEGKTDVVIGTHRLFGKDVAFKDLGLLILDEEQRFGVEHKEKIKTLKTNVDTLTLTATPIPRTLHMSLSGIRSISTINTPPKSRIPVQTCVAEESDALLRDAITREIARGGQVFVLYNSVDTIARFSRDLGDLLPEAKIITAHGQMPEKQLEKAVMDFYDGKADILVATTIIENGIDLPNANTLIVIDADRLGLSTLYQLKGRVGRGSRLAHAYFTFKPDKVMSEAAYKRLNAITEFADMGSGFKIAMRDLEIRGAGNVLGREQHGHMERVGYELYSKILKEELNDVGPDADTELDVRMSAFIPEQYMPSSASRMDCYKQIAEIKSKADKERILSSLTEVYGRPPLEVVALTDIAALKHLAKKCRISKVIVKNGGAELTFADLESLAACHMLDRVSGDGRLTLSVKERPTVVATLAGSSAAEVLSFVTSITDQSGEFTAPA